MRAMSSSGFQTRGAQSDEGGAWAARLGHWRVGTGGREERDGPNGLGLVKKRMGFGPTEEENRLEHKGIDRGNPN